MNARRLVFVTVALSCSLTVYLALSVSVVLAAAPPLVEEESVSNVAATSATLQAQINPEGSETTYRFEYGTGEAYGQSIPVPDGLAGSGTVAVTIRAHPQDLSPGTVYHFRVVGSNAGGTVAGPDRTFTSQSVGAPFSLPDGRQWELVSPATKFGAQIFYPGTSLIQDSEGGSTISYAATAPFAGELSPANLQGSQAFSVRGANGWSTQDISMPNDEAVARSGESEYPLFSSDLSRALASPLGATSLSPEATEKTIYVRDDATGSYTPMVTASNVTTGVEFGKEQVQNGGEGIHFVAATPDLSHVVLRSRVDLTSEGGAEPPTEGYYEWAGGRLRLIDKVPAGTPPVDVCSSDSYYIGSHGSGNTRHAISDDGSRIFWGSCHQLYLSDMTSGKTIRVNQAQGVAEPEPFENQAEFQIASSDGSEVFFIDSDQLTTAPGGGLYVYDVQSGKLTLLTVPLDSAEAADFTGVVMGAAEDGSYVYFVAGGVLSNNENKEHEKATQGANNLYVLRGEGHGDVTQWNISFIAGLSSEDTGTWKPQRDVTGLHMNSLTSRVSPNGRYLAFMSERSLTGYDNSDAGSGIRDEEVYLYDAASAQVVCASCDPTGARPEGRNEGYPGLEGQGTAWANRWVAASVPGWAGYEPSSYQPRYLSDSGRLYFDSSDALAPQDVDGTEDVYQYEPARVGGCELARGCVSLISGGVGPVRSLFADASVSGDDVFFVTDDRLLPEDFDSGYDMYDAHVCSSAAPCFAPGASSPPPCSTGDSCKPASSPQPAVFGAPPSATFVGVGNVAAPRVAKVGPKKVTHKASTRCVKGKKRSRGRCVKAKPKGGKKTKAKKTGDNRRGK